LATREALRPKFSSTITLKNNRAFDSIASVYISNIVSALQISAKSCSKVLVVPSAAGYLCRAELLEGLKSLFRPITVVVLDLELICENMLMAEGFIDAEVLATKFTVLYSLCRDLLSKADHYGWALRAIKSLLVVAGAFKRAEPKISEGALLMRVEAIIEKASTESSLCPEEVFILEVVQLSELLEIRHYVFVMGPSGAS
jgi:dynein heavy chain